MLEFTNTDVAAKYTSTFNGDPVVHYPGGNNKNGWKKKLSTITLAEADQLFAMQNQNSLSLKLPAVAAPAFATKKNNGVIFEKKEDKPLT